MAILRKRLSQVCRSTVLRTMSKLLDLLFADCKFSNAGLNSTGITPPRNRQENKNKKVCVFVGGNTIIIKMGFNLNIANFIGDTFVLGSGEGR
jgi:hypothetical protein